MSKHFVALRLAERDSAADAAADAGFLRGTLDSAFGTLGDVLAAGDSSSLPDATAAVAECRAQLAAAGLDRDALETAADACFRTARTAAAHARSRAAEQRMQVAALVATVQDTVASLAGGQATLTETLTGSAARFERLARVGDLQQIQAQLFAEVAALKRITLERRAAWDRTFKELGTRLAALETQLDRTRREAEVDPLTGVANRRAFERLCRERLQPAQPGFVMALVDVDNFKTINDAHGHAVGDRVLVGVAETLARSLRAGDVVARLGGDEFAALATGLTLAQAEGRFAAIGRTVQSTCAPLVPGAAASISVGVAECSAGDTLESLQQRADAALYIAKRAGKGRVATKGTPFIRDLRKAR